MTFPSDILYTKDHEWVDTSEEGFATVGITSYALEQLGEVVHLELPEVGDNFESGASFGTIESTKTVSDLYMPISGKITEINAELADDLDSLSQDPYSHGWLVKISYDTNDSDLLTAEKYEAFVAEDD